ncbi:hypothetical protein D3C73_1187450 [compost metagenome]
MVGRHLVVEPGLDRFPMRCVRGQRFFVTIAPALDLPCHIAFGFAQVAQAVGVVVDLMQLDETVDETLAQGFGFCRIQAQLRRQFRAQDDALDPFHHVELGADHRFVSAMHIRLGAVRETVTQLIEDAEFAAHVVGGLGLVAKWRATQDEFLLRVFEQVGEV